MFFVKKLDWDEWAVIKYYEKSGRTETWRYTDTYEDAVEICHYFNGGTTEEYKAGRYRLYEWKLVAQNGWEVPMLKEW